MRSLAFVFSLLRATNENVLFPHFFEFFHCFKGTHCIHVVKRHNNSYSYKLWRYIRYIIDFNREIDLSLSFLSFKTLVNDFLLVCPAYNNLRVKFLPRYCMSWPTLHKFDNLMKQNGNNVLSNVAKFISAATKLRSEMLV